MWGELLYFLSCGVCGRRHSGDSDRLKVVVVGGGFAGLAAVRELDEEHDVTLVEPKDYFEYTPGVLRALVWDGVGERLLIPLEETLGKAKWVQSTASEIESRSVVLENGDKIPFDVCLVATGSRYPEPMKAGPELTLSSRLASMRAEAERLHSGKRVLVVGGGAVGVELAAELLECRGADVELTLATGTERLLPTLPEAAGRAAQSWLEGHGARVLLGSFVNRIKDTKTYEIGGHHIEADQVVWATGLLPHGIPVLGKPMTRSGEVETDQFLHPKGTDAPIFVIGDAASPPVTGEKLAHAAEMHGILVAESVRDIARKTGRLRQYPQDLNGSDRPPRVMVTSLGPYRGITVINDLVISDPYIGQPLGALIKHIIEVTKIWQAKRSALGALIWHIGDTAALFVCKFL